MARPIESSAALRPDTDVLQDAGSGELAAPEVTAGDESAQEGQGSQMNLIGFLSDGTRTSIRLSQLEEFKI